MHYVDFHNSGNTKPQSGSVYIEPNKPEPTISMKTDRISLFILAVEIVLITALHSAKRNEAEPAPQLVKGKTIQYSPTYSSFSVIGLKR